MERDENINLDDLNQIAEIDKSKMLEEITDFPEQIKKAREISNIKDISSYYKIDNIIISGMGGSSISGDIVHKLLKDRIDIPIFVTRQYELPKWANKNTLVISQTYSGNTEETLFAFKHAYQKHCKIIAITSGGKLEEYCNHRNIPILKIPEGLQPRAAIGYILFLSILALKQIGIIKYDIESEIDETIEITKDLSEKCRKEIPEKDNIAKQISRKIFDRIPQVYGWEAYTPIAKRWCTQFNENSKLICKHDEVSEANHNDIVGWSMNPEVSKKFACMIFRDDENETIYMKKRLDFMKKLFNDVAAEIIEIQIKGKKRLSKMMYAMLLGDYISCYLAILRNIDPTPVEAINELKDELAKL